MASNSSVLPTLADSRALQNARLPGDLDLADYRRIRSEAVVLC